MTTPTNSDLFEDADTCPNCNGPIMSKSLRLQATPIGEGSDLLVERLSCVRCGAEWEEWD